MAGEICGEDCCDVQSQVLDLAANLNCNNLDPDFVNTIIASGLLKLLCQSFIVYDAWTPVIGVEQQGNDLAFTITDWFGGSGTKPDTGYIGASGIVETFAEANLVNIAISLAGQNVYIGDYEVTEDISSLRLVNIHGNDQIRKADAVSGYEAHGIITQTKTTGQTVSVYSMGVFAGFSGLSGGVSRYLGENGLTVDALGVGYIVSQKVGVPKNATSLVLDIEEPVSI